LFIFQDVCLFSTLAARQPTSQALKERHLLLKSRSACWGADHRITGSPDHPMLRVY
jgi:hypothetical protein